MNVSIITQDPELIETLAGAHPPGTIIELSEGVRIRYEHTLSLRGFSTAPYTAQLVKFVIEHIDTIITGVVSAWLYERLKGRKVELHIGDDDDVTISPEAIRAVLGKKKK